MSSIYDIFGSNSSSNDMYSTLFGTGSSSSTTNSNSLVSSLGDLNLIKNGAYKKSLKAYYATLTKDSDDETISGSGKTDSKSNLSTVKSAASKLKDSVQKLQSKDYSSVEKSSDLLSDMKSFVDSYNSTLEATKKLNSYSILQTAVWTTQQMGASESALEKIGITINDDNTLKLDETKFASADVSSIKALFSGNSSLAERIGTKASTIAQQSANQIAVNSGRTLYTASGTFY